MSNIVENVLVIGAAGGVGRLVVEQALAAGQKVAVASRSQERASSIHGVSVVIEADCSTSEGARAAVAQTVATLGRVDAVVNAAGSTHIAAAHRTSEADYRKVMAANIDSAFFTLSAFVDHLREAQHPGRMILFSSIVARIGVSNHEAIAAAKGAVEALVRSAAATYAPLGLAINAIAPGITDTPLAAGLLKSDAIREAASKQYPLPGIGDPAHLASLVMWLLSPAGARVNGQTIAMDAGFTAVRPLVR